ncbi:hypothetical protein [Streptomyces sp. NPDC048639]|uniref:hypothetical protein n=1 Tax=Streptomyces sp. NPDC048639 TaxID=3365581 RepID=UPI00371B4825
MSEPHALQLQALPDGKAELRLVLRLRWEDIALLGHEAGRLAAQTGRPISLDEAASHRLSTRPAPAAATPAASPAATSAATSAASPAAASAGGKEAAKQTPETASVMHAVRSQEAPRHALQQPGEQPRTA